jgi:hypothetical protein
VTTSTSSVHIFVHVVDGEGATPAGLAGRVLCLANDVPLQQARRCSPPHRSERGRSKAAVRGFLSRQRHLSRLFIRPGPSKWHSGFVSPNSPSLISPHLLFPFAFPRLLRFSSSSVTGVTVVCLQLVRYRPSLCLCRCFCPFITLSSSVSFAPFAFLAFTTTFLQPESQPVIVDVAPHQLTERDTSP